MPLKLHKKSDFLRTSSSSHTGGKPMRLSGSHLSQHGIINSTQENRHHMHSQHDKLNPESSHSNLFNVPS